MEKTSYTFVLDRAQQEALIRLLREGNYRPLQVPYARAAAEGYRCRIALYPSGKCLVQGRGAQDWVTFELEPKILQQARLGYEHVLDPAATAPHLGVDESGKGDFFGPLVIAAAYTDAATTQALRDLHVRDSKSITSDRRVLALAGDIGAALNGRFSLVTIGPEAYNRLYARMRNVNRLLAWGHARAIENLLEKVPDCPRGVCDQFGPARQVQKALMKKGRRLTLEQHPRAESDPAVAAASVLARAAFLRGLKKMEKEFGLAFPKGASDLVKETARKLVEKHGPAVLVRVAKCHFKTTDAVLAELHLDRAALGPMGQARSKPAVQPRELHRPTEKTPAGSLPNRRRKA